MTSKFLWPGVGFGFVLVAAALTHRPVVVPASDYDIFGAGADVPESCIPVVFVHLAGDAGDAGAEAKWRKKQFSDLKGDRGLEDISEWVMRPSELRSEADQLAEISRIAGALRGSESPIVKRSVDDYVRPRSWGWLAEGAKKLEDGRTDVPGDWAETLLGSDQESEKGRRSLIRGGSETFTSDGEGSLIWERDKSKQSRRGVNWRSSVSPWRSRRGWRED